MRRREFGCGDACVRTLYGGRFREGGMSVAGLGGVISHLREIDGGVLNAEVAENAEQFRKSGSLPG